MQASYQGSVQGHGPAPYQQQPQYTQQYSAQQHAQQYPAQYPQQQPANPHASPSHAPQQQQAQQHAQPPRQPQAPQQPGVIQRHPESFKTSLYGCHSDWGVCCYGWFCLPCLYGSNVSRVQGTGCTVPCLLYTCCPCFSCIFGGRSRQTVRIKYNLHEEPCSDCCVHCWCSPCGVCQEARELKQRG